MPVAKPHYLNVNGSSEDGMDDKGCKRQRSGELDSTGINGA